MCKKRDLIYTRYIQLLTLFNEGDITPTQQEELDHLDHVIMSEQDDHNERPGR